MKLPNTVSLNTFKTYYSYLKHLNHPTRLNASHLNWENGCPETLQSLCTKTIAINWSTNHIFYEIIDEDKNVLMDILDIENMQNISEYAKYIKDNKFWKRCYVNRWPNIYPHRLTNANECWITLFMEKYLSEMFEQMAPNDYDANFVQQFIELCSPFVRTVRFSQLIPSLSDRTDHIPLDLIISQLKELRNIDITFNSRTLSTQFFIGCTNVSADDIKHLAIGLKSCNKLTSFRIHSSKLDTNMVKELAKGMEERGNSLKSISMDHCRIGDAGIILFFSHLDPIVLLNITQLNLANNFLSYESMVEITTLIQGKNIKKLDLRLNPLGSAGVSSLLDVVNNIPIEYLNLSCCSMDESIIPMLLETLKTNTTLRQLDLSCNQLGKEFGSQLASGKDIYLRRIIDLDLRYTGINSNDKYLIDITNIKNVTLI